MSFRQAERLVERGPDAALLLRAVDEAGDDDGAEDRQVAAAPGRQAAEFAFVVLQGLADVAVAGLGDEALDQQLAEAAEFGEDHAFDAVEPGAGGVVEVDEQGFDLVADLPREVGGGRTVHGSLRAAGIQLNNGCLRPEAPVSTSFAATPTAPMPSDGGGRRVTPHGDCLDDGAFGRRYLCVDSCELFGGLRHLTEPGSFDT